MSVMEPGARLRVGIDVGGTFTDIVAVGPTGITRGKVPSTPANPAIGVVAACELIATELGTELSAFLSIVERFGLGTTVVTNVLATRTGARLGLITTRGFEDLIPLARGNRVSEDGWLLLPPPLVDRVRIVGVGERVDRNGTTLEAVDGAEVAVAAKHLVEVERVDAVVVSLLWSFKNPANERAVRDAIATAYPDTPVILGSDLAPVIREYERTQFALLNAYVGGALDWLDPLATQLHDAGLTVPIVLTHSSGGATTVAGARAVPIGLAQSGPAAGAAAATELARRLDDPHIVTCDLGGTSLDVALIAGGEVLRRNRGSLLGHWAALSMVDVDSVGSGGGSLAWVDSVGAIRVGPQSAGADPGPACYGRGGVQATLTDALVVLGFIDPARFLHGRMPLDADRAHSACAAIGQTVGLDPIETAWGVREVALASMVRAVRNRIATRGLVASELSLMAYGGCGGLFACDVAYDIGARRAVLPDVASVFSAYGAATAVVQRERVQSLATKLPTDESLVHATFDRLRAAVLADLEADGVPKASCRVRLEADVRFDRQGSELTVPVDVIDGRPRLEGLEERFKAEYARRFGQGAIAMGVPVELMTLRAIGSAVDDRDDIATDATTTEARAASATDVARTRLVHFERYSPPTAVAVYDRHTIGASTSVSGPALVDAGDTTVWVQRGYRALADARGALIIEADISTVEDSR
jgi:N-methylhydantoinase A